MQIPNSSQISLERPIHALNGWLMLFVNLALLFGGIWLVYRAIPSARLNSRTCR